MSVVYNLVWFKATRPMVHVVMRHLRRDGEYDVAAREKSKIWDPSRPLGPDNPISGRGTAHYTLDGNHVRLQVVRETVRAGDSGGQDADFFEGAKPDPSVCGAANRPLPRKSYRWFLVHLTAQQVVPAAGWLVGAVLGRGSGYRPLITGPIGWMLAGFLAIAAFRIAVARGALRDVHGNRSAV
jgi:hypothetical protein